MFLHVLLFPKDSGHVGVRDRSKVAGSPPQSPYIDHAGLGIMNKWVYKHVLLCFIFMAFIIFMIFAKTLFPN